MRVKIGHSRDHGITKVCPFNVTEVSAGHDPDQKDVVERPPDTSTCSALARVGNVDLRGSFPAAINVPRSDAAVAVID